MSTRAFVPAIHIRLPIRSALSLYRSAQGYDLIMTRIILNLVSALTACG